MNKKEAIIILSGGIKKNKDGNWVSSELKDTEVSPGGKSRVIAASYLFNDDSERFIITTGQVGSEKLAQENKHPNISVILKKELIELGVPEQKIIEENNSNNTFEQLSESVKVIKEHSFEHIIFISNRYHLSRIEAMIEKIPELKELLSSGELEFKASEEILIEKDPKWKEEIDRAYSTEAMKERIALEEKGVRDLKEGKYKLR